MDRLTEYKRGFHWLYLWSICYIIIVYVSPIIFYKSSFDVGKSLPLPLVMLVLNLIIAISFVNNLIWGKYETWNYRNRKDCN